MEKIYHEGKWYTPEEMKEEVHKYYDGIFERKRDRHYQMWKLFPDDLNSGSIVLDYGCGKGGIADRISKLYGCRVDAVDISENELEKAKLAFNDNDKIRFTLLSEFDFPSDNYDLVCSFEVIEHVHNPGMYLYNINKMLKEDAYLLIGLPNIVNFNYVFNLLFYSQKRARKHSLRIINNYNKANDHINGWDPLHFIQFCGSLGFELIKWAPLEGTPMPSILSRVPFIGKYLYVLPFQSKLCYKMFFLFKKKKMVIINPND